MDNSDKLKIGFDENKTKLPITEVEKMFIDFIEDWHDDHMKHYTDLQYGKGPFRKLVGEAKKMIAKRNL